MYVIHYEYLLNLLVAIGTEFLILFAIFVLLLILLKNYFFCDLFSCSIFCLFNLSGMHNNKQSFNFKKSGSAAS